MEIRIERKFEKISGPLKNRPHYLYALRVTEDLKANGCFDALIKAFTVPDLIVLAGKIGIDKQAIYNLLPIYEGQAKTIKQPLGAEGAGR